MTELRTILLVEDNPDDLALAEAAFARLRVEHHLAHAGDGEQALAYLIGSGGGAGPVPPDLVLLDLKLPGISGLEVLRRMRGAAPARLVPVVVLTSSIEEQDVRESYRLGANSYIRKPTDFDEFVAVLRSIIVYWLESNQPPPQGIGR
jgi:two-component system response regulator